MSYKNIYTVLSGADAGTWRVVKMNRDFEEEKTYLVTTLRSERSTHLLCECFAGTKDTCRHRQLVGLFQEVQAVDSRRAYDFDKARWITPPKAAVDLM